METTLLRPSHAAERNPPCEGRHKKCHWLGCLEQVLEAQGTWRAAGHGAIGLLLLACVLLNYWLCVTTSPGFTTDIPAAVSVSLCRLS